MFITDKIKEKIEKVILLFKSDIHFTLKSKKQNNKI